ncbi:MAG: LysR family transcriptional regulator [Deltaproteobacteria bacterium]|nr:LysR family transcriptional regulator [Deltaproteobacteria bacterium]
MTFNQFMVFSAVARHLNISKAARELKVSQPSVSKQLRLLERHYHVKLYYRKQRGGIELTKEGRVFLTHVREVLSELETLKDTFQEKAARSKPQSLTVGGSYSPSAILLPSVLALFQKQYPRVRLRLRTRSRREIEQMILNSEVDLAVINRPSRSPRITSEPYRWEKLVTFIPATHPLARTRTIALSQITKFPLILGGGRRRVSTVERIAKELVKQGYDLKIGMRCDSPEGAKTAVKEQMGVGLAYEGNVQREIRNGEFKQLRIRELKNLGIRSYIIYRKERLLSIHAQHFRKLLHAWRARRSSE